MQIKRLLALGSLLMALTPAAIADDLQELTPAFPGAEGFGRYVTGGRGGKVYRVTNLNDSGTGSLRWALSQAGPRIIVFGVSGTIHLKSSLGIPSNTTVAGQSAPGDGICLADYPVSVSGSNVIVRYMRFRLGNKNVQENGADGWDAFGGMDQQDIIVDHCSVSWSIDECCSFLGNKNTTVQWCIVSQSLVDAGHSKGSHGYGGNWGGSGASFHHNLIAHHTSRTPRLGPRPTTQMDERMDYRNNVIYNFGGNGCYGGEAMRVNIVNNYYKPGPGSPTGYKGKRIAGIGIRTTEYINTYPAYAPAWHIWGKYYVEGNVNATYADVAQDNWANGMYNQIDASGCDGTYTAVTKDTIRIDEPIAFVLTTTHSAEMAYERVLDYAGVSRFRDSHDELMVSDTRNRKATYRGTGNSAGFINSQEDNRPADSDEDWSAWPTLETRGNIVDYDGDGMDDNWEDLNNLDPTDPSDGNTVRSDGYTNVEYYLNSLVSSITNKQNEGGDQLGDRRYAEVNDDGSEPGKVTVCTGDIKWPFGNDVKNATVDDALTPYVTETNVGWGANVSYNASRNIGGIRFAEVKPSQNNEATANANNAVSFRLTMTDGYFFRPTNISFLASRIGTDGGMIYAAWTNENGEYEIVSGLTPDRNNTTPGYSTIDKEVTAVGSASGTSSLDIHIYKLGNSKVMGLSGITVSGEVKQQSSEGIDHVSYGPVLTQYYSLDGTLLASPRKGMNIMTTTLPDGTRQSRKVIFE